MTAPQLTQYANSIASALVADEYNTLLQGCDTFAQLRAFKGAVGQQVYCRGKLTANDGFQGNFRYVVGSTADDNLNNLQIAGSFPAAFWQRLNLDAQTFQSLATIAALRLNTTAFPFVFVQNYATASDQGGGLFFLDAADTSSADNGGTIIVDASGNRWYRQFTGPLYLEWFGGAVGGVADNTTALTNALAASNDIVLGVGVYYVASNITKVIATATALKIAGQKSDLSSIKFAATKGLTLSLTDLTSSFHLKDFSFLANGAGAQCPLVIACAANISNPALGAVNDLTRLTFRGSDGYAVTNYFATGTTMSGVSNVYFIECAWIGPGGSAYQTNGVGVNFVGTSTSPVGNIVFLNPVILYLGTGISYGTYSQGLAVYNPDIVGCNYGIVTPSSATNLDQLCVMGGSTNCATAGIYTQTGVPNTSISGVAVIVPQNGTGINLVQNSATSISACTFSNGGTPNTGQIGVSVGTTISGGFGIITGNAASGMATAFTLLAASTKWNIQSNAYLNNTANTANAGTSNTIGGGSA